MWRATISRMPRKLIVTHHAPDLDAITSVWLLKRFDSQHYADAKVAFVRAGHSIDEKELAKYEVEAEDVTHVDTGLGEFDHHQDDRGKQRLSAASLVFEHICKIQPDKKTDEALSYLVEFVTGIDHFEEIFWPEPEHERYDFMIHSLIRGIEYLEPHNDDSQLQFGFTCLDSVYHVLKQHLKAREILHERKEEFTVNNLRCCGIETNNEEVVKVAQKAGFQVVIRKDPDEGHIRIKARPDAEIDLKYLAEAISKIDTEGEWYYHPSGKMLLNGSRKKRHTASPLSLEQVIKLMKENYG